MPRATVALVLVALAAGCGGTDTSGDDTFAYDEDAPLAVEAGARVERDDPLVVREVSFASGNGRVEGYLAMPPRSDGRVPGVVYLHGSGGERSQLLPLAEWLAARGAVALTLTLPSGSATPPTGLTPEETLRWQRDTIVADAVAVRRAFDMLAADERVDRGSARARRLELRRQARCDRGGCRRPGRRHGVDVGRRGARVGVRRGGAGRPS